ncbi:photosystem I assembly protein Ycf3 [Roseimaritima multifibrata]|uniref:Photosystem I assembly protein Ycf3 n=2 Tax=Roseimaritima multifibrata TaxID=1930274 RepID=A0A517MAY9_9BACT|nr:photosystem I assembly protein Ycf3 [Roseimaritima multifibrata]
MTKQTKNRLQISKRTALGAALLVCSGCVSGGGPSLAGLNPFNKNAEPTQTAGMETSESKGITGTVAATAQGARGQVSTMSSAVKSAYGKTTSSIAGIFSPKSEEMVDAMGQTIPADDPLRLDNKPDSIGPEVFVANGQLWETTGDLDKALENYNKALKAEPTNAPALASVARLKFRQSLYKEASDYFRQAVQSAPNDASLYNDWGLALSKLGEHEEAAKTIQKALAIAPGTARYANVLASVQFDAGQSDKALETLTQHNKPAVAHFNMAYLEFNQGNYDRARLQLNKALSFEDDASDDSAVRRAIDRSKELLARLDGPAGQIANVAQAAPQAYDAAKQLSQTVNQVMATSQQPGAEPTADQPAANPVAGPFTLPPDFYKQPAAQTAQQPSDTSSR